MKYADTLQTEQNIMIELYYNVHLTNCILEEGIFYGHSIYS